MTKIAALLLLSLLRATPEAAPADEALLDPAKEARAVTADNATIEAGTATPDTSGESSPARQECLAALSRELHKQITEAAVRTPGEKALTVNGPERFVVKLAAGASEPDRVSVVRTTNDLNQAQYTAEASMATLQDILAATAGAAGLKLLIDEAVSEQQLSERLTIKMSNQRIDSILKIVLGLVGLEYTMDASRLTVVIPSRLGYASEVEFLRTKAVEAYDTALLADDESELAPQAHLKLAQLHLASNSFAQALEEFRIARNLTQNQEDAATATYGMGLCFYELGDNAACREQLFRLIDSSPHHHSVPNAYFLTAESWAAQNRQKEAILWYRQLLENGSTPLAPDALLGLGKALFERGEYAEVVKVYSTLFENFPTSPHIPEALFLQAKCYQAMGEHETAQGISRYLLTTVPENKFTAPAYLLLARSYRESGMEMQAIEAYLGVIERYAQSSQAQQAALSLSELYSSTGLYQRAIKILETLAMDDNDSNADLRLQALDALALAQVSSGDTIRAEKTYELLARENAPTLSHRAALAAAGLAADRNDHRKALELLAKLLKDNPDPDTAGQAYRIAASCYRQLGQYEKALRFYQGGEQPDAKNEATEQEAATVQ